ncbi:hypothetical protein A3K82_00535 [Candidatus Pacearchaeota archaeon RBG_19FT_COMBO_34_9]|nr:MAG: hypothetical protein A3K82_00535 [Candidatus Pacearchaeota archaeon RBG_19FT_COMBO_34_9]OGJ16248.1 MAG: hypothetical protein A3K74_03440 [Candidatus Pacearchaeota archaeon RBG_13_33_26]
MLYDFFILALNNLKRRKLRSWLTVIGIVIGIAAVVGLISIGQGLQEAVNEQFASLGADKITIMGKAGGMISPFASEISSKPLTERDIEIIREISGVEIVSGLLMKSLEAEFKGEKKNILVYGIEPEEYSEMFESVYTFYKGRALDSEDKSKIILGYNVANKDFEKKIGVGDKIKINEREFEVVGLLEKIGDPSDDSSIILNIDSLKEMIGNEEIVSMIFAKINPGADIDKVAEEIEKQMKKERDEKLNEEPKTFVVQTSEQLLEAFGNILGIVQAVLVGIAAISLFVGGVGIMNTMYTSILERTKEIGIMKAIGAKNTNILTIFLFEAGLIGLIGGVIGVSIGIGIAKATELIAMEALGTRWLKASANLSIYIGALIFAFLIGVISGTIPALRASKLKPVDALRYE